MYIDVHCHLELLKDIDSVIASAEKKNVRKIVAHGVNKETNRWAFDLSKKYEVVECALGIYPIDALKLSDQEIEEEIDWIRQNREMIAGIGEVGMDYKEDVKEKERQAEIFKKFINLSKELDKPIIVHSRQAEEDCIKILESLQAKKVVMHCFCGKKKLVQRILDNGWMLSIPSSIGRCPTFQENAKLAGINKILCETDSPFMHPEKVSWKEKQNTPENVIASYEKIAELLGMPLDEVEGQIEENYKKLFG